MTSLKNELFTNRNDFLAHKNETKDEIFNLKSYIDREIAEYKNITNSLMT